MALPKDSAIREQWKRLGTSLVTTVAKMKACIPKKTPSVTPQKPTKSPLASMLGYWK